MMGDNVPGFPGYHVTRSGNVYSRRVERSPNKFRDWHLLKTTIKRNGRVKVVLYRSSKSYTLSLSRLVALIHVYNPLNNHYKNLQWGTHSMNMQQMIFEQRRRSFKTTQNPNWQKFKISLRKKRRLDRLIKLGRSRIYIGKRLKVSRKTIYNSLHRG